MSEASAAKQEGVEDAQAVADMYRQQAAYSHSMGGWLSLDKNSTGFYNPDDIQISTYAKMLRDPQVGAALDVTRLAVMANDWQISYEGDDEGVQEEVVKFLENELSNVNAHTKTRKGVNPVIWEMMTAMAYGFSVAEIVLGRPKNADDFIHLDKLKVLDPETITRMRTDKHGNLKKIIQTATGSRSMMNGTGTVELHPDKCLLWSYNMEFGNWWGKSDFRRIYPNWFVKHFLVKFWNIATEKFAMPYVVGQAPDDDLDAMMKHIKQLQKRSAVALGPGKKIDLLKGVVDRGAFLEAIQYHDRKIMTGLLIPTLIIEQEDVGAYSMSKTHFSTFIMRVRSIQNQIEDQLNGLIKMLVDLNFRRIDVYPKFKFDEPDRGDLGDLVNVYAGAINTGLADPVHDHVWMREKLGFPEADPESSVVNPPPPPPPMPGDPTAPMPPEGGAPPGPAASGVAPSSAPPQSGEAGAAPSSMPIPTQNTGTGKTNALKPMVKEELIDHAVDVLRKKVPQEVLQ